MHTYSPRHSVHAPLWLHRLRARWALALAPVVLLLSPGFGASHSDPAAAASGRAADSAGSQALGSAVYSVPSGAVFVSTKGSDANSGTQAKPVRTFAKALSVVPNGGTIVARAGYYHESITISSKKVTIQNYPREYVVLEGGSKVTGWVKDGSTWRKDGWTQRLDASAGFSKGDRDGTSAGWQYVSPNYPMAAHPDQFFVDRAPLRQVSSRSKVVAGTFFLDTATSKVYIGTNPSGREVLGSTLTKAIAVRTAGSVIRGIGITRYSPSIWHIGAVSLEAPGTKIENVVIDRSATIGLGVTAADATVRKVSVLHSGLLGIHAATADRLVVDSSKVNGNNSEHFNNAPVSGGIKVGRTRTVTVRNSAVSGNLGYGFWADVSVYDMRLASNNMNSNYASGAFLEISSKADVVNNLFLSNRHDGIKVNNTSSVRIWNNTFVGNGRSINLVQDSRTPSNTSYGHDTRYPNDPTMTWVLGPVQVRNNVIARPGYKGNCLLCVEDYTFTRSAEQFGVTSNNNLYNRAVRTTPGWTDVWSSGQTNPEVYTSVSAFIAATGQDRSATSYDGVTMAYLDGTMHSTARSATNSRAAAIPSDLASLAGVAAGSARVGVWGR